MVRAIIMMSTGAEKRRSLPLPGVLADGAARASGNLRCILIQRDTPDWQVSSNATVKH